jgi:hypothetical protein
MTLNLRQARADSFHSDGGLWIVVRHFLTADLVRELGDVLMDAWAPVRAEQDDRLLEWSLSSGPSHLANVALRLRKTDDKLHRYFQNAIGALVASDDRVPTRIVDDLAPEDHHLIAGIESAFVLSTIDLASLPAWRAAKRDVPRELEPLISCLDVLIATDPPLGSERMSEVIGALAEIPMPLRAAVTKHVGDLCLDADRPEHALQFYLAANGAIALPRTAPWAEAWAEWLVLLDSMLRQSEAAARRLIEGPAKASEVLPSPLFSTSIDRDPLIQLNASADAFSAHILASDSMSIPDIPFTRVLLAPALLVSHDLEPALSQWRARDWSGAQRSFWAVLRRQIALGSATYSRTTKAFFGQCILDELTASLRRHRQPESFRLALRLLLESGDFEAAAKIEWGQALLARYVDVPEVQWLLTHVSRHAGSRQERKLVLIALSQGWLLAMPREATEPAAMLLLFLAKVARDDPWDLPHGRDLAQRSFSALEKVAEERPDLTELAAGTVAGAVLAKLDTGHFRACWGALETALSFAESFSPKDLSACLTKTLEVLAQVEPTDANWPVVRPAIGLLSSPSAQRLWVDHSELGRRCADTILRFGLGAGSENVRLLFLLKDLVPYISPEGLDDARLQDVINDLRRRAHEIRSSAVVGPIAALLEAPALSKREGVDDAIEGLTEIMRTASTPKPSLGLATAYEALLQLVRSQETLFQVLGLTDAEWKRMLEPVTATLLDVWHAATGNPALLANFSIPFPTAANPTIVHNWTFASLAFGEAVGELPRIETALALASVNPELRTNIAIARAIRMPADYRPTLAPEAILEESREPFYAALGQRLALLASEAPDRQPALLAALLKQCLRHGPEGLDAGVLAVAIQRELSFPEVEQSTWERYEQRLGQKDSLRFSLSALLRGLSKLSERHGRSA